MIYKMAELVSIIDGDRGSNYPKQKDFFDTGYCLFLDTGNVTQDGFSFNSVHFITEEKCNVLRNGKMQKNDLAYTTRGTIGNVAYYNETVPFEHVRINSGMVILRANSDVINSDFLYQVLKHKNYRTYFKQFSTGSAQPQLPIKNLSQIKLDIPNLETQSKIAKILFSYDNIIENGKKQISLLNEIAHRLYNEWFVNLHFPGCDNIKNINGIPEGWQYRIWNSYNR